MLNECKRIKVTLIQEYIELTKTCASTGYEDKKSVRLHNK